MITVYPRQIRVSVDWERKYGETSLVFFAGKEDENEIVTENASFVHTEPPQDGSGPPKVDAEVEILQEKVTKQIIKEGHGQKPSKYSMCFCK